MAEDGTGLEPGVGMPGVGSSRGLPPDPLLSVVAAAAGVGAVRHVEHRPQRFARFGAWPDWVNPQLYAALRGAGIEQLWSHQVDMAESLRSGRHSIIATGTASGKSLAYQLPVVSDVLDGSLAVSGRGVTALYLAPTKALAADQRARLEGWALPGLRVAGYDGDTPQDERRWVRRHAAYVLTNPDMVHRGILPAHERWAPFLRALRYVVVDECHVYRGVFGAHVAAVLRRLLRVADHYGSAPVLAFASATIEQPEDFASLLAGMPVAAVTDDGAPRGPVDVMLVEPPVGADGRRRGTMAVTADVLAATVRAGAQGLAFVRSRAGVETVAGATRDRLAGAVRGGEVPAREESGRAGLEGDGLGGQGLGGGVQAYRGGYLPEERRALEDGLRTGRIRGLATTNALELGIDVSGLDVVVMAGWPGTHASFWQEAGRAGRAGGRSIAALVAADDPLDAFLIANPRHVFGRGVGAVVTDPSNPLVLARHLACAAAELPLTTNDAEWFGDGMGPLADSLVEAGLLRRRVNGWYWTRPERPADAVDLRGVGQVVQIVDALSGRVVGTVDSGAADRSVHPGAVYVHQGQTWVVRELDLDAGLAEVVCGDPGWTTHAIVDSSFIVTAVERSEPIGQFGTWNSGRGDVGGRDFGTGGDLVRSFGRVRVTRHVVGYRRKLPSGEILGEHALDLPEHTLDTQALWWTLPEDALVAAGVDCAAIPGSLHAAEHAAIGVLPLFSGADRWDLGGVSTQCHPDTGSPTVMVYDGHAGGAGFARRGWDRVDEWLAATRRVLADCGCATGCPACVLSPKCGNGNDPIDKSGAAIALDLMRGIRHRPSRPRGMNLGIVGSSGSARVLDAVGGP